MAIVKVHNKARNITYVYESKSYWDKELKQPRSHRKLIGRIDPVTGEIVPTSRKARNKKPSTPASHNDTDYKRLYEQALSTIDQKDALIHELRSRLAAVEDDNRSCHHLMEKVRDLLSDPSSEKE